jgi:hypothetical protein
VQAHLGHVVLQAGGVEEGGGGGDGLVHQHVLPAWWGGGERSSVQGLPARQARSAASDTWQPAAESCTGAGGLGATPCGTLPGCHAPHLCPAAPASRQHRPPHAGRPRPPPPPCAQDQAAPAAAHLWWKAWRMKAKKRST